MGRDSEFGQLTPGRLADLLILSADPSEDIRNMRSVRHVMRRGELRAIEEFSRQE